jgi:four helix bundle protein
MSVKRFEELEVWVEAKNFSVSIYKLSDIDSFKKDFSLRDQIRRASVSIVSNIAEGFERNGNKEFIQFLSYAKGSAGEVRAQLYILKELNYISNENFDVLYLKIESISKMISGFMNYLKQSELKGVKYSKV